MIFNKRRENDIRVLGCLGTYQRAVPARAFGFWEFCFCLVAYKEKSKLTARACDAR